MSWRIKVYTRCLETKVFSDWCVRRHFLKQSPGCFKKPTELCVHVTASQRPPAPPCPMKTSSRWIMKFLAEFRVYFSGNTLKQRGRSLAWLDGSKTQAQEQFRGSYKGHAAR
ncbi:unnamed protein product [Pleuronectes platessa]|uniref:Uncharacterized protein n=1 Tax=Pleuronectes platessa TaxID=8262 RepID=A0A9N7Y5R0_PLEPL|nr:unnamed protein product [Pleuronectes platessa]